jgi:integrase/recombinase XerD
LNTSDVESFIRLRGGDLKRESLQHVVAHLRYFLKFLSASGNGPVGLDSQIDTPRVYRLERLPNALPHA